MSEEDVWVRAEQMAWRIECAFETSKAVVSIVTAALLAFWQHALPIPGLDTGSAVHFLILGCGCLAVLTLLTREPIRWLAGRCASSYLNKHGSA